MNMELTKTTGVVLRRTTVGEGDALLTILTRDMGVIKASVKGAKNYKNRNSAGTAPFSYSEFVLHPGREIYRVNSCLLLESFYNLSTNIERLAFANYAAELASYVAGEGSEDSELLPFVLNTFYLFANSDKSLRLVKSVFELGLLSRIGFSPQLLECYVCGKKDELMFISARAGGVCCAEHAHKMPDEQRISKPCLMAMRHISSSLPGKAFSFTLSQKACCELEEIVELFMKEYIARDFYSHTYLNKIIGK